MTHPFITIEGGDGCGKTTQVRMLQDVLGDRALFTREPGGTPEGMKVRQLLIEGDPGTWEAESELCLVNAVRVQHVERLIKPTLQKRPVICDRFIHTTLAYQGGGGGIDIDKIMLLHEVLVGDMWPDLTIILDLPPEVSLERAMQRGGVTASEDRFEKMGLEFQRRVHETFLGFKASPRGHHVFIDATQTPEAMHKEILAVVQETIDAAHRRKAG